MPTASHWGTAGSAASEGPRTGASGRRWGGFAAAVSHCPAAGGHRPLALVVAVRAAGGARIDERVIPKTRSALAGAAGRAEAADHAGRPETRFDSRQMPSTASGSATERAGPREAALCRELRIRREGALSRGSRMSSAWRGMGRPHALAPDPPARRADTGMRLSVSQPVRPSRQGVRASISCSGGIGWPRVPR